MMVYVSIMKTDETSIRLHVNDCAGCQSSKKKV